MSARPDSRRLTYAERQRLAKRRGLPLDDVCHGRPGYQLVPGHCDAWPMQHLMTFNMRRTYGPPGEKRLTMIHGNGLVRQSLHWIYLAYPCQWKMSHGGAHIELRIIQARMAAQGLAVMHDHEERPGDMHPAEIPQHICTDQESAECSTVRELERLWIEQQTGGAS